MYRFGENVLEPAVRDVKIQLMNNASEAASQADSLDRGETSDRLRVAENLFIELYDYLDSQYP